MTYITPFHIQTTSLLQPQQQLHYASHQGNKINKYVISQASLTINNATNSSMMALQQMTHHPRKGVVHCSTYIPEMLSEAWDRKPNRVTLDSDLSQLINIIIRDML